MGGDAGSLLSSTTVTSADPLVGHFRFNPISPITLNAGQSYRVGGTSGSDIYTWNTIGRTVDPSVTFVMNRYEVGNGLAFPAQTDESAAIGIFGANFQIGGASAAAPEPGTLALLGLGGPGMAAGVAIRRRRSCKA